MKTKDKPRIYRRRITYGYNEEWDAWVCLIRGTEYRWVQWSDALSCALSWVC